MTFFSGGRDLHCLLSASALLVNIWALYSCVRGCQYICCSVVYLTKTCAFPLGERDSQYCLTAAEFVFQFCLKKHSARFFIWAGVRVLRTFAICMQLLPYFSYSCINIMYSSWVHLPLFIFLFGKLASATFPDPKKAGIEINCNDKQLLCPMANWVFDGQRMSNKEQMITNNKHWKQIH